MTHVTLARVFLNKVGVRHRDISVLRLVFQLRSCKHGVTGDAHVEDPFPKFSML